MLNLIPRVHFPNEVAIKRGSLLRLKYFDSKGLSSLLVNRLNPQTHTIRLYPI
jgi:hypothetical protein